MIDDTHRNKNYSNLNGFNINRRSTITAIMYNGANSLSLLVTPSCGPPFHWLKISLTLFANSIQFFYRVHWPEAVYLINKAFNLVGHMSASF